MLPALTFNSAKIRLTADARLLPALVFAVSVLITAFAMYQMRVLEDDEAFANFKQSSRRLARDVELRLASLTQLASSGAGLLNSGAHLDRKGWASYIGGLQTIGHGSGFQGLGVAFRVPPGGEDRFVARIRKDANASFRMWADAGTQALADGRFPVTYLVPESLPNQRTIGFDLGSDPALASAIALARDRGEATFSGRVRLTSEGGASRGHFFLLAPFYTGGLPSGISQRREAFAGVVLIVLNVERLLQPLVEQDSARGIALRVTEIEQGGGGFDTAPGLDYSGSRFVSRHTGALGGRKWQLDFAATPERIQSISHRASLLVGLVGAIGALLLTGIAYHLATLRRHAEQRAAEMTAELRSSEEELLRHRDHLAELVDERTAELSAAKSAAEHAYRVKSEFLTNMSHELRTPLHAILSFSRLGLDRTQGSADDKSQRYFSRIVDSGERLLGLVGDLLDMSKVEAGKMLVHPKRVDLARLLREVAAEFETLALARGQRWQLPPAGFSAPGMVDPLRFGQVLRHVLSNAMKFTPDGGRIRVTVDAAEIPPGRRAEDQATLVPAWRIAVADSGVGIPEDELERVFDAFAQSSKTRTAAGGKGLGLAICREIVVAHRGTILARNRAEGGTVFEILVPCGGPGFAELAMTG